jgi:hypothetical protein
MTGSRIVPLFSALAVFFLAGADWPQFRGADGSATSADSGLPERWDNENNLIWKAKLPGWGNSSPIVLADRVYLTCYSGYGTDRDNPGNQRDLVRHLMCFDRKNGGLVWKTDIRTDTPEVAYQGQVQQHGYASSTPATDGKRLYVLLGTAGVFAFDLNGNQLWKHGVGTGTDRYGSGSSVRLFEDLVLVNASIESGAVVALKKENGDEVWRFEGLRRSWGTPAFVETGAGQYELVVSSQERISGLDPRTGKELWHCEGIQDYTCPSVVPGKGVAYVTGGRTSSLIAVRAGGSGDVTNTDRVLWRKPIGGNVPTPVLYNGHLFGASDRLGIAWCVNADTGEIVYKERLSADVPVRPAAFQPGGRGRQGGGGDPGGLQFYASAVAADGKVFILSRTAGMFVFAARPAFEVLARDQFAGDEGPFDGTPAISDGRIFLRSNAYLYCVGAK